MKISRPSSAYPVEESPISAPEISRMHFDISSATSALTAPCFSRTAVETPSIRIFVSLEYATMPVSKQSEDPGRFVIKFAINPPVQDSAVAIFNPF